MPFLGTFATVRTIGRLMCRRRPPVGELGGQGMYGRPSREEGGARMKRMLYIVVGVIFLFSAYAAGGACAEDDCGTTCGKLCAEKY